MMRIVVAAALMRARFSAGFSIQGSLVGGGSSTGRDGQRESGNVSIGFQEGTVIDQKYRLVELLHDPGFVDAEEIGKGSFGVVYKAYKVTGDGKLPVAVKVLHEDANVDSERQEMHIECSNAQRLDREMPQYVNWVFVDCYEDGHAASPPYLALEYLGRTDMRTWMTTHQKRDNNYKTVVWPLLEAVAELEHRGYIHGDLKPENIMLYDEPSGRVLPVIIDVAGMVFDGGSARILTPSYLRPGDRSALIGADSYALGLTISEFVCDNTIPDLAMKQADRQTWLNTLHGHETRLEELTQEREAVVTAIAATASTNYRDKLKVRWHVLNAKVQMAEQEVHWCREQPRRDFYEKLASGIKMKVNVFSKCLGARSLWKGDAYAALTIAGDLIKLSDARRVQHKSWEERRRGMISGRIS